MKKFQTEERPGAAMAWLANGLEDGFTGFCRGEPYFRRDLSPDGQ